MFFPGVLPIDEKHGANAVKDVVTVEEMDNA